MILLNVDPPADVAAILAGVQRVVAVRGVPCGRHNPPPGMVAACENLRPPADLVAATEDCTTCGGAGWLARYWEQDDPLTCPACEGHGKPVTLVTTCERCHGGGWVGEYGPAATADAVFLCPNCTNGQVSHGRVVIGEVLRVAGDIQDASVGRFVHAFMALGQPALWVCERRVDGTFDNHHSYSDQLPFLPPVATLTEGGWYLATLDKIVEI